MMQWLKRSTGRRVGILLAISTFISETEKPSSSELACLPELLPISQFLGYILRFGISLANLFLSLRLAENVNTCKNLTSKVC